jgi:hyperosmotically inducible protein
MSMKSTSCVLVAGAFLLGLGGCANTPTERNQTVSERVDDGWITTKIKSGFAADNLVRLEAIHVNTDNGVVHLSGAAKSQEEANRAIQIARNVKGVRSVRNEMQVQGVGAIR